MKPVFRSLFVLIFVLLTASGCWAPRCPMKSCHVSMEHRHEGQVFRGRYAGLFRSPVHGPGWYFSRNTKQEGGTRKNKDPKTKRKFKKLLPWEKV